MYVGKSVASAASIPPVVAAPRHSLVRLQSPAASPHSVRNQGRAAVLWSQPGPALLPLVQRGLLMADAGPLAPPGSREQATSVLSDRMAAAIPPAAATVSPHVDAQPALAAEGAKRKAPQEGANSKSRKKRFDDPMKAKMSQLVGEIAQHAKHNRLQPAMAAFKATIDEGLKLPTGMYNTLLYLSCGGLNWECYARGQPIPVEHNDAPPQPASTKEELVEATATLWAHMQLAGAQPVDATYAALARVEAIKGNAAGALSWAKAAMASDQPVQLRMFHPAMVAFVLGGDVESLLGVDRLIASIGREQLDLGEYEYALLLEGVTRHGSWPQLAAVLHRIGRELNQLSPSTLAILEAYFRGPRAAEAFDAASLAQREAAEQQQEEQLLQRRRRQREEALVEERLSKERFRQLRQQQAARREGRDSASRATGREEPPAATAVQAAAADTVPAVALTPAVAAAAAAAGSPAPGSPRSRSSPGPRPPGSPKSAADARPSRKADTASEEGSAPSSAFAVMDAVVAELGLDQEFVEPTPPLSATELSAALAAVSPWCKDVKQTSEMERGPGSPSAIASSSATAAASAGRRGSGARGSPKREPKPEVESGPEPEPELPEEERRKRRPWLGYGGATGWRVSGGVAMDASSSCLEAVGLRPLVVDLEEEEWASFSTAVASLAMGQEQRKSDFQHYMDWHARNQPYDILIDGANVAYHGGNRAGAGPGFNWDQIIAMVKLVQQQLPDKRLLLMLHIKRVRDSSAQHPRVLEFLDGLRASKSFYATPTGSNDDWYWLYATVQARSRGLLISNDELRDHIWSLLRPKHFLKWKSTHIAHYTFTPSDDGDVKKPWRPALNLPPTYTQCVQELEDGSWIFPCTDNKWLCVSPTTL